MLALGGASWPETGSDGTWPAILAAHGIEITPWQPANCGWEVDWPPALLARAEGLPLKNLTVRAGEESVSGELLITAHGLEGGAIYRLGRTLRGMSEPCVAIDFKPQLTVEALRERIANVPDAREWFRAWKLSAGAVALLETISPTEDREELLGRVKNFLLPLRGPRPIAEAISSAGGVPWAELDENLMLRKLPGIFVAGEMIDWEAPTGGYLTARLLCHRHSGWSRRGGVAGGLGRFVCPENEARRGGAVLDAEFGKYPLEIFTDRSRFQSQDRRDLGVGLAAGDPGEDFSLTSSEKSASAVAPAPFRFLLQKQANGSRFSEEDLDRDAYSGPIHNESREPARRHGFFQPIGHSRRQPIRWGE